MRSDTRPQFSTPAARIRTPLIVLTLVLGLVCAVRGSTGEPPHHAERILVKPKRGVTNSQMAALHSSRKARVVRAYPGIGNLQLVAIPGLAGVRRSIEAYRKSGLVEYAEPDYEVRICQTHPNDRAYTSGLLWGLNNKGQYGSVPDADIDASEAWSVLHDVTNVVVAVIDTGIRYAHEDLAGNMWVNPGETPGNGVDDDGNGYVDDVYGINAITGSGDPLDDNRHGSHVSGILGGVGNNGVGIAGVAWSVRIMACKFLNVGGNGSISDAIECMEYARSKGAQIMNNSWGSTSYSQSLYDAIAVARNSGIIFVAAAGNGGPDQLGDNNDTLPFYPASYDLNNILSVAATDREDQLGRFSNYGLNSVDLGAPGVDIYSASIMGASDYELMNGTSQAAPQVSGALALLKAMHPGESYSQLISHLLESVDPVPALAGKCRSGGRLNLHAALTHAPADLQVSPVSVLRFGGMTGGPFASHAGSFRLSNHGTDNVSWTALSSQPWLTLSSAAGIIGAGGSMVVDASVNSSADALPAGVYSATVTFANTTSGSGSTTREVALQIGPVHVRPDGDDARNGSNWSVAKRRVTAGLDAASPGQEVWVAAGTYGENVVLGPAVGLYGGFAGTETAREQRDWTENVTTLDGHQVTVVTVPKDAGLSTRIDGFTIRNGTAIQVRDAAAAYGGGIFCLTASPTIANNIITQCDGDYGGGGIACIVDSFPLITGNTITRNIYTFLGTGIYCSSSAPTISDNVISENPSSLNGVVHCAVSPVVFSRNKVIGNTGSGIGLNGSDPTVEDNLISGNTRAGIQCPSGSDPLIRGNTILRNGEHGVDSGGAPRVLSNVISGNGGAGVSGNAEEICGNTISGNGGGISSSAARVACNIISGNLAYGISGFPGVVANNTIVGNTTGINLPSGYAGSSAITRNIVAFNEVGVLKAGGTATLSYNDVFGNTGQDYSGVSPGTGDMSVNPQFASVEFGDLHIQPTSPCRNAGDSYAPELPTTDVDGQSRIEGAAVDIGADESYGEVYSVSPRIVYVDADEAPGGDGANWGSAYHTIQEAMDDTLTGGGAEIWVAEGAYPENLKLMPFTQVYGGFAGDETSRSQRNPGAHQSVIDGGASTGVNAVTGANRASVDGFTITGGGHRIYCYYASTTITGNVIHGSSGYGVYCLTGGRPLIKGNTIYGNARGVFADRASPVIEGNRVRSNTGAGVWCENVCSPVITDNLISGGSTGVECVSSSTPRIINNTIVGCDKAVQSFSSSVPQVMNNVIAFNTTGLYASSSTPALSHNDVYGNYYKNYDSVTPSNSDISADPRFASLELGDLHIQPDSPCRNSGDSSAAALPATDMDGQPRIEGTAVDIGADESQGETHTVPTRVVYVDADAPPGGGGSVWTTAYRTIGEAITDVVINGGAEIWVAEGTYAEQVKMAPFAPLYGGFAGVETAKSQRDWLAHQATIDGTGIGGSSGTVVGANVAALDGFTVRGTYGLRCDYSSPEIADNIIIGGGVACSYGTSVIKANTVYNSSSTYSISVGTGSYVIRDNNVMSGYRGVVVSANTSAVISGNTISGHQAEALYCNSATQLTVRNNRISGSATGIYCQQVNSASITNNTIVRNASIGISSVDSGLTLSNNVVAFNGTGISASTRLPTLSHNDVYGNTTDYSGVSPGADDISQDPMLASLDLGDLHIQPSSPCRNAGSNSAPGLPETDMEGQPRIQDGTVDVGADESDGTAWTPSLRIVYVDSSSAPGGNGSSWAEAYNTIGEALSDVGARGPAEIWIARGVYAGIVPLVSHCYLYGGFIGLEVQRGQRNWRANPTIIDGGGAYGISMGYSCRADGFRIFNADYGITYARADCSIANNAVVGCQRGAYGFTYPAMIANNLIAGCNIGIEPTAASVITNNTVVGCSVGLYCKTTQSVLNNILAFNVTGISGSGGSPTLSHNDVYGNVTDYSNVAPGAGDISLDPKLACYEYGDLHIQPDSPCRDAGDNSAANLPALDMDAQPRAQDGLVDIGADESDGSSTACLPRTIYVNASAPAGGNGIHWSSAYRTIGSAMMDVAMDGGAEIWVAPGTYEEALKVPPFSHLYGGFAGNETSRDLRDWRSNTSVIHNPGTGYAVNAVGPMTLDGFSVEGGSAGVYAYPQPVIRNNTVGTTSTGISTFGNAVIENNTLALPGSNSGGIGCTGPSSICGNVVMGAGFGVTCDKASVVNNTIVGSTQKGITCSNTQSVIANNVVAFGNTGIYSSGGSPSLQHNDVYGNTTNYSGLSAGPTDISADPLFSDRPAGDVHLLYGSPCMNAGWSDAPDMPPTDTDGEARVQGRCVDIGADEISLVAGIWQAKLSAAESPADIVDAVVTATFPNAFYIEADDRAHGIRVEKTGHGLTADTRASVLGVTAINADGEKCILADAVSVGGTDALGPVGLANREIGGGNWFYDVLSGTGQERVLDGYGLNNIGLYVRTWGKITQEGHDTLRNEDYLYIDDGSDLRDGTYTEIEGSPVENVGVRVICDPTAYTPGDSVEVTGISSCFKTPSGDIARRILTCGAEDVRLTATH